MQINWFTVIAQVINFLILVWLLRRFLYKPILKAVDERENKIATQIKDAKAEKAAAKKEQEEFAGKNEEFDNHKMELMDKAVAEIKEKRQSLLEEAKNDADKLIAKLEESAKSAQEKINHEISQKTQDGVFAISRKALSDIASVSLEEQAVNIFIKRLAELNVDEKNKFIAAFSSAAEPVLVRSAFALNHKQETEIKASIKDILGSKTHFQFSTVPELISGIELTANGYKLGWSISEYLHSFEKIISEIIKDKTKSEAEKNPETEKAKDPDTKEENVKKEEPKNNEHAV
jgi:F-type H+-transporting ATPase subunit b